MASETGHLAPGLHAYVTAHTTPPDPLLTDLIAETAARFPDDVILQIGPEQGMFMTMLAGLVRPRLAVEVGTFTGYSSICIGRGLAEDGKLICCDINENWTSLAQEYWRKADLEDRIELRLGPGLDTLRALPAEPALDLAFIDADKTGYLGYWEEIVPRTRPGGIILVDNALLHGRIFEENPEPGAQAIAEFNEHVRADDRVESVLLAVGDGLVIARKK